MASCQSPPHPLTNSPPPPTPTSPSNSNFPLQLQLLPPTPSPRSTCSTRLKPSYTHMVMARHNEIIRFSVMYSLAFMVLSSNAIGYAPDPKKYDRALRNVVESRCRDFEKLGVTIDPARLKYGEEEIVDSFLNGREFYRTPYKKRIPLTEKLDWLSRLLGKCFEERYKAWATAVENRKKGTSPRWTPDRIRARLNELAMLPESPVKLDDGLCRSSTAGDVARIDYKCIHCGRHTVYTDVDNKCHNQSPEYFKRIAGEIKEWGLDIEVDGRDACPDCCKEPHDFKLSTTPEVCRIRPDARIQDDSMPSIMPGIDLKVVGLRKMPGQEVFSFKVQCVLPEAWVGKYGTYYEVYAATNDLCFLAFLPADASLKYVEPRVTRMGRNRMRLSKVIDFSCMRAEVRANRTEAVKSVRSSELLDIPPTYFIVNGHRFAADESTAEALLAFVQGYTTFISGYFSDHHPIQRALPRLRECLGVVPQPPTPNH